MIKQWRIREILATKSRKSRWLFYHYIFAAPWFQRVKFFSILHKASEQLPLPGTEFWTIHLAIMKASNQENNHNIRHGAETLFASIFFHDCFIALKRINENKLWQSTYEIGKILLINFFNSNATLLAYHLNLKYSL